MKTKPIESAALSILVILFLAASAFSITPVRAASTTIYLQPSNNIYTTNTTNIGTLFNISVWVSNAPDLGGAEVYMEFNDSIINCTRDIVPLSDPNFFYPNPPRPTLLPSPPNPGYVNLGPGRAKVMVSISNPSLPPAAPFGGSGLIVIFEFNITAVPTTPGTILSCVLNINSADTFLLDPTGSTLADVDLQNGYYEISTPAPSPLSVSISASSNSIYLGQSVLFTSTVSGGSPPYTSYQWFQNGSSVPGVTSNSWTYTPATSGTYTIYLNVTDSGTTTAESNTVTLTVLPPLTGAKIYVDPSQIIDLSMGPSSVFAINVTVANIASLADCAFNLSCDPAILTWTGFDFLQVQGEYPAVYILGNSTAGFVSMNLYYPTPVTAAASVPLVTMRFHVISYGITPLHLANTQLLDQNGNPITHNDFDGFFANIRRDVAVTNVIPQTSWVYQTWTDNINVTVANIGNVTESFNVSAWYDGTIIGTMPVTSLAPNSQATVIIPWNTTGVPQGNYTITGTASLVPYESYFNTTNNVYVDGIVQVMTIIHDVAITNITPTLNWAYVNSTVPINVTASNLGNATESFTVTAYYDGSSIDTIPVPSLASNTSTVLTFNWNTSGITIEGNYTLSAFASLVPQEYNTTNNYLAQGQVLILTQIRDVAITNVVALAYYNGSITPRPWVYQGTPINVTVTASNTGQVLESFNVMAFYDTNLIGDVSIVNLTPGDQVIEVFTLNTTGLTLYHNYTISGQASTVQYDFNATNNVFVDGNVTVRLLGDVNGDGIVNLADYYAVTVAFGSFGPNYLSPGSLPSPNWNPDCDFNQDNKVDLKDLYIVAMNFGETYP
jgi:hypothetical protein